MIAIFQCDTRTHGGFSSPPPRHLPRLRPVSLLMCCVSRCERLDLCPRALQRVRRRRPRGRVSITVGEAKLHRRGRSGGTLLRAKEQWRERERGRDGDGWRESFLLGEKQTTCPTLVPSSRPKSQPSQPCCPQPLGGTRRPRGGERARFSLPGAIQPPREYHLSIPSICVIHCLLLLGVTTVLSDYPGCARSPRKLRFTSPISAKS